MNSPNIIHIVPLDNYNIRIVFSDNIIGTFNCLHLLTLPLYNKLTEYNYFSQAEISKWGRGDIIWPNGEDISASHIYEQFTA